MLSALKELGFDKYDDELREFLKHYNDAKKEEAQTKKRMFVDNQEQDEENGEAKRAKNQSNEELMWD